jgi:hypothetical protein
MIDLSTILLIHFWSVVLYPIIPPVLKAMSYNLLFFSDKHEVLYSILDRHAFCDLVCEESVAEECCGQMGRLMAEPVCNILLALVT